MCTVGMCKNSRTFLTLSRENRALYGEDRKDRRTFYITKKPQKIVKFSFVVCIWHYVGGSKKTLTPGLLVMRKDINQYSSLLKH